MEMADKSSDMFFFSLSIEEAAAAAGLCRNQIVHREAVSKA